MRLDDIGSRDFPAAWLKKYCEAGYEREWYWPAGPAEGYVAALWGERICREVSGQGFGDSWGEGADYLPLREEAGFL